MTAPLPAGGDADQTSNPKLGIADLCDPCWEKWKAWLGYIYRPDPQIITIGRPPSGSELGQRKFETWRDRVRENQNLIIRICARRHQVRGS